MRYRYFGASTRLRAGVARGLQPVAERLANPYSVLSGERAMKAIEKESLAESGSVTETLGPGVLVPAAALEADWRQSALMRALAQITPAVAHDLRAPINAMVFNVEILKETIASGKGAEPGGRERQLRYVHVLKEELARLHRELEIFLSHISPRGDHVETLDLRELAEELAVLLTGPARKQQVQIRQTLPDAPVSTEVNRYLVRQALLHLGLAALIGVPKEGTLEIRLERRAEWAWLRLAGSPPSGEPPVSFEVSFSSAGTLAQLHVAKSILAAQGGRVRLAAGEPQAYEVELMVTGTKG